MDDEEKLETWETGPFREIKHPVSSLNENGWQRGEQQVTIMVSLFHSKGQNVLMFDV